MAVKRIKIGGVAYDINDPRLGGIDNTLSGLSTNPLQNDVITAEFAKTSYIGDTVEDVDDIPEEPEEEYTIIIGGDGEMNVIDAITFNGSAVPVTNKVAAITASIPTESTVSGWGFTKNTGTVTKVQVGSTDYTPVSGVVSLPAYPTVPTVPTISTNISSDASSDVKTASPKAVKTYVDNMCGDIETLLAALL